MNYLKVKLWGQEIGRLTWAPAQHRCYFLFNPAIRDRVDVSPLLMAKGRWNDSIPAYGDNRRIYQDLPPFIADSLPDSWGNMLFDQWVKDNKIPRNKITPLYKLMFIGRRGMGGLEYEPASEDLEYVTTVDIKALYDLSLQVLEDRVAVSMNAHEEFTLQTLLAVGTSAGGRQMKAIVAINPATGEIRSGQADGLADFEYCLLKFGNEEMPTAEIEMAYHEMAIAAGITMEPCRLIAVENLNHFLTRRFDRKDGHKLHIQTLAAINPEAKSYEDLMDTCRELRVPEREIREMYRRLVFNVLANNTDDHNKNFSFMLAENGNWGIAPAYDMTFIFDKNGTGPMDRRCLSIGGKFEGITMELLLEFAQNNNIRNAQEIIKEVGEALLQFPALAKHFSIKHRWSSIIWDCLRSNLERAGVLGPVKNPEPCSDSFGRELRNSHFKINRVGHYDVELDIDNVHQRRFIRPNMPIYAEIQDADIEALPSALQIRIAEQLFPPEK
jgi:serine/threonine-protein kinase HipA